MIQTTPLGCYTFGTLSVSDFYSWLEMILESPGKPFGRLHRNRHEREIDAGPWVLASCEDPRCSKVDRLFDKPGPPIPRHSTHPLQAGHYMFFGGILLPWSLSSALTLSQVSSNQPVPMNPTLMTNEIPHRSVTRPRSAIGLSLNQLGFQQYLVSSFASDSYSTVSQSSIGQNHDPASEDERHEMPCDWTDSSLSVAWP